MSLTKFFSDNSTPGPSGPITAWAWDFGDGNTSTTESPTHTYAAAGTYSVQLTVTGTGADGTATVTHSVIASDPASITASFSSSSSGLAVTFTDASTPGPSGPITAYHWDFGDGNTSTSTNPSHTYASAGTYTVVLTVTGTGSDGTDDYTHNVVVTAGGTSFLSVTSASRPSFTPTRTVNFSTSSELSAAISGMAAGDLIKYNGTGVLNISNFSINNKNPASNVVIDFGTHKSIWDSSHVSTNYVKFNNTNSSAFAISINSCSHLTIYGGDLTGAGRGIEFVGPNHHVIWWDAYVHDIASQGMHFKGVTGSGVGVEVHDNEFRLEVDRFCMNPALDPHSDKGTGLHGVLFHDTNGGNVHDNTIILYAHDSLRPGESSYGKTWPEGGGGSAIEIGSPSSSNSNNTFYVKAENLLMVPNGTNPGSTIKQTGGNAINLWGNVKFNGMVIGWVEGTNLSGNLVHAAGGSYWPGSPAVQILHGRYHNICQSTAGSNSALPYMTSSQDGHPLGFSYNDMTSF